MNVFSMPGSEDAGTVAEQLLKAYPDKTVWLLYGSMGAGKTTLIKAICQKLGVIDPTSSPTFSIVNEYHTSTGKRINHFDFYRIKSETEALDIGFEEYLYSGDLCLIEWPEKIGSLLPQDALKLEIRILGTNREVIAH